MNQTKKILSILACMALTGCVTLRNTHTVQNGIHRTTWTLQPASPANLKAIEVALNDMNVSYVFSP